MRVSARDRYDLYNLFSDYLQKQERLNPLEKLSRQPQGEQLPARLQFKFLDSFESNSNGAQQWLVRRESSEPVGASNPRAQRTQGTDRTTRTLFAESSFEPSRTAPVDLGQTRSTVNRWQQSPNQTQAAAQGNGFSASVNDL